MPAVSGMGCGLCGSSRSRMAFNAWVWGDSDRGSKSTSRRSAVIRTARSLSVRSSRGIMPNMARKRSDGKARPTRQALREEQTLAEIEDFLEGSNQVVRNHANSRWLRVSDEFV